MRNLRKTKVITIALLMFAFVLTLILLGINTAQNQAAQDSSAYVPQCLPILDKDFSYCSTISTPLDCGVATTFQFEARDVCCYMGSGQVCKNNTWSTPNAYSLKCANFYCGGPTTTLQCINSTEMLSVTFCKNNPAFKPGINSGGGTTTPPVDGGSGGSPSTPSTPSCTPQQPTVAKLVSPRNKTEIKESKVVLMWDKNGNFGKECNDNGNPDRFILKYAVVNQNKNCPSIGSQYTGRQLIEKQPNQKQYAVEISKLQNDKKYCWFIRKKNGETKSETKVRSFITKFTVPETNPAGGEVLKLLDGATTIEVVNNAE